MKKMDRRTKWGVALASAVALGAVAAGGASLSGALFTSEATVGGQKVGTGTVAIAASTQAGSSAINVGDLLPGDTASTTVTVRNTGTASSYFSIELPKTAGDAALESAVQVSVAVGSVTETHSLTGWQGKVLRLAAPLAASATQDVVVTVALPLSAPNSLQGLDAGFGVDVASIQARNNTTWTPGLGS